MPPKKSATAEAAPTPAPALAPAPAPAPAPGSETTKIPQRQDPWARLIRYLRIRARLIALRRETLRKRVMEIQKQRQKQRQQQIQ